MKKLLFLFIVGSFLSSCSDSSSKPGAALKTDPVFEKATSGTWVSDCLQGEAGPIRDMITIGGGKGTTKTLSFPNETCQGTAQSGESVPFTYTVKSTKEGVSELTLSIKGQSVALKVAVTGEQMTVDKGEGPIRYQKAQDTGGGGGGNGPGTDPGKGSPTAMAAFDLVAKGVWINEKCNELELELESWRLLIEIQGGGRSLVATTVFPTANCTGVGKTQDQSDVTYSVEEFANGRGKLILQGKESVSLFIQGQTLTIQGQDGKGAVYKKLR
jgi:hypothetical protein